MKRTKRILSLVMAVILTFGMIPKINAKAEGAVSHFMVKNTNEILIRVLINAYVGSSTLADHTTILGVGDEVIATTLSSLPFEIYISKEGDTSKLTASSKFNAKIFDTNKAKVGVDELLIIQAIDIALAESAKAETDETKDSPIGEVEVKVIVAADSRYINSVETKIPIAALAAIANSEVKSLKISTPIGDIIIDHNTLQTINTNGDSEVVFSITKVDPNKLDLQIVKITKERPVYEFEIFSGDKGISEFNGGKVTVSIPYELKVGEDPYNIIVYYMNANGELEVVADGRYNAVTKQVTFTTTHFSKFTILHEIPKVLFLDVHVLAWYKEAVYSLVERRITTGTTSITFEPSKEVTRAEFILMLAKLSREDLSKYSKLYFSDVSATAWYANATSWAKANGIEQGNDGKFSPNSAITREEMAVMIANYMVNIEKVGLSNSDTSFADEEMVAGYAKVAVSQMRQAGIIAGKANNNFAPKDTLTKAEAAQVIKNMLK